MSKREEIVEIAKGDIGKNRVEVGCAGDYAWCADWVSKVLIRAGIGEGVTSTSCTLMQRYMSESPDWSEPEDWPIPGDPIFLDWNNNKAEERPLDHVGICVDFNEYTKQITYVNGNGSSDWYVTEQEINVNAKGKDGHNLVAYWMRYISDRDEKPTEDHHEDTESNDEPTKEPIDKGVYLSVRELCKGCTGGDVKTLQRLLFADGYSVGPCGDDGDFGNDTEKAVLEYQRDHGLSKDGIVGVKTLTELWNCKPMKRK